MANIGKAASDAARALTAPPDRMAEVTQQSEGWTWRDGLTEFQAKCAANNIPAVSPEEAKAARDMVCEATGRKDLYGKSFGKMDFADYQVLIFGTDTYVGAYVNSKLAPPEVKVDVELIPVTAEVRGYYPHTVTSFSVHVTRKVSHNYNSYEASVGMECCAHDTDTDAAIDAAIARCKSLVDAEIASDTNKGAE